MAIEDSFWKSYFLGTKEEMEKFRTNNAKYNEWGEDITFNKAIKYEMMVGGPLCISLGLVTVIAPLCWLTDTAMRGAIFSKHPLPSDSLKPGLVGTVRELYQKYKK